MAYLEYYGELQHLLFRIRELNNSHNPNINKLEINYCSNLIELVLKRNAVNTKVFFEQVAIVEDIEVIYHLFKSIVFEFQDLNLLNSIEQAVTKCTESKYYTSILENYQDSKNGLLIFGEDNWEKRMNHIYKLNVVDLIAFLEIERDKKVLNSIVEHMSVLTKEHMSQHLIDYISSRLNALLDNQEKERMMGILENSVAVLKKM